MEAKEVMVGDWVKYGNRFAIIQSITTNECCILVSCGGSDELVWETYDNIEPIPLTTEFLEKNGFTEIKGAYPTFKIDIYGYLIKVTFPKENKKTNKEKPFLVIDSRPSYYSSECLYVHELQHVLKLLGIKKEIEL